MYNLLVKIMLISVLAHFGMSLTDFAQCRSRQCLQKVEGQSRDILRIDWKPISLFPKEAKRFR